MARPADEPLSPVDYLEPGALHRAVESGVPEGVTTLAAPALSFDLLQEQCRKASWTLDPRFNLFGAVRASDGRARNGSEEFRTLRSRLYQMREKQPLRTLLVTSALPAEGKTFVAANLAQVIVRQHERRALLIDADLRWSRLHVNFGTTMKPGLSDYLMGDADELGVIQRGPFENLFLIPGGSHVANPAELISSGRMEQLLRRMAPLFDWVILDSPPAVPVSDASLLADLCDGVLLVVRSAQTPYDMAQRACQEFKEKHLIGVVLNDVDPGAGYSSYYYQYYRGRSGVNGKGKEKE